MAQSKVGVIAQDLVDKIKHQQYKPGDYLPSEHQLMDLYGASRETIRKALNSLTDLGLIQKIRGKGSIVLNLDRYTFPISGITSFAELNNQLGLKAETKVLLLQKEAFEIVQSKARDNSRVPMHWDNSKYAGFSESKPWLMPTDQDKVNVEKELREGEIFNFYQKLIKLRKSEELISAGHIKPLLMNHPQVMAYERYLDNSDEKLLVFANFYGKETKVEIPTEYIDRDGEILIQNYDEEIVTLPSTLELKPYEALAIKI